MGKTELLFSRNMEASIQSTIKEVWGVQNIQHHDKYLGLPSFVGKSRFQSFKAIKDRVWAKLQGWKEKLLSQAGREVLIKAVVQAIPTYTMSCFQLPKGFCKDLEGMFARFWWGQRDQERRLHWLKWSTLCQSKFKGGMGFRDLESFNLALLAKQGWRLLHSHGSLFTAVFKAKYFPNSDFLSSALGSKPSYVWRSIYAAKAVVQAGSLWRIGQGDKIKVRTDH
ncbi:uncharacterized mitochondrial protein AtMg00310-like [Carya illinoinensis]|uniref:uncharacterized mitochondrial protein AtMg00310-like n=1 Tax=Carya illinoinensis TaxID=32201 RepID=UPI001C724EC6|nr:uncharacterized mitochondrial protein AtMg00310-like [Carya illinoinensis]